MPAETRAHLRSVRGTCEGDTAARKQGHRSVVWAGHRNALSQAVYKQKTCRDSDRPPWRGGTASKWEASKTRRAFVG